MSADVGHDHSVLHLSVILCSLYACRGAACRALLPWTASVLVYGASLKASIEHHVPASAWLIWLDLQQRKRLANSQAVQLPATAMADNGAVGHSCNHSSHRPSQHIGLDTTAEHAPLLTEAVLTGCSVVLQPVVPNVCHLQRCLHTCCALDYRLLLKCD